MRIEYKQSINEKIDEAILQAKTENKTIERIILNNNEYDELTRYIEAYLKNTGMYYELKKESYTMYNGIKIEEEKTPELLPPIRKNMVSGMLFKQYDLGYGVKESCLTDTNKIKKDNT